MVVFLQMNAFNITSFQPFFFFYQSAYIFINLFIHYVKPIHSSDENAVGRKINILKHKYLHLYQIYINWKYVSVI